MSIRQHMTFFYPTKLASISDIDGTMKQIRYLDIPSEISQSNTPLVLLCGTAQTVETWTSHLKHLSKNRRLIIPELRCQGKETNLHTEVDSLNQYILDLDAFLKTLNLKSIDLGGFSFGGRVAIAYSAYRPDAVRKLFITGVPHTRPELGQTIIHSWQDGLLNDTNPIHAFRATAWSMILNGFSDDFIAKYTSSIHSMVDMLVKNNDPIKLSALIRQSNLNLLLSTCSYSVANSAPKIQCPTLVLTGSEDRLSSVKEEEKLAKAISKCSHHVFKAGHLLPFEKPIEWRRQTLAFLDSDFN